MSETWEEIVGSLEKAEEGSLVRSDLKKVEWHQHESEEITTLRRARALEAIFTIMPHSKMKEDGSITAEVEKKKFDFWPASDCYFIYSTQKYGHGIEKLCEQILKHLLQKEKAEISAT